MSTNALLPTSFRATGAMTGVRSATITTTTTMTIIAAIRGVIG